jgi:CheY-like chemotaxis protein/two-component sensor histidine kinase
VLDVSRIISGKLRLYIRTIDLTDVVRGAVEAVLPTADAKGVAITLTVNTGSTTVSGDPERLQQVIWNLLSNAVKFTARGGRVHVQVEGGDATLEVTVSDTGIGIGPEFLPHIFERFRQADAGMARERGGLGLGLSIARQLVESHGGTIRGASQGLGTGATFSIRLPRLEPTRDATFTRERPVPAAGDAVSRLQGVTVLAVDDDPDALAMVRDILESSGARVVVAESGNAAMAALAATPADVLVSDVGMPTMDGHALIESIRQDSDPRIRDLPAVALTSYARPADGLRALRSGFQLHLAKPIDASALIAAVLGLSGNAVEPLSK